LAIATCEGLGGRREFRTCSCDFRTSSHNVLFSLTEGMLSVVNSVNYLFKAFICSCSLYSFLTAATVSKRKKVGSSPFSHLSHPTHKIQGASVRAAAAPNLLLLTGITESSTDPPAVPPATWSVMRSVSDGRWVDVVEGALLQGRLAARGYWVG